jgi:23S rRNA G2069 N7-methylase RlmK/C1962 C5-methylase RlmI
MDEEEAASVAEVEVLEHGVRFSAAPGGQKTGFYADQVRGHPETRR